jgi:hypothetical protein
MKSRFGHTRLLPLSCALLAFACGSDDGDADETADGGTGGTPGTGGNGGTPGTGGNVDFEGEIAAPTTWTADKTYTLTGHVFVRSTLTIQAGTRILGKAGSSIVVTQDGTIDAQGTADAPIVFTSASPEGSREAGDWGGVVLLGRAPINVDGGNEKIEGFADTETRTGYGGDDPAHNCGTLKYVRIEFAGYELAPDNELNGLSVGACGAGTELDYVQIHKGADDGIEFFGGTASIKHLLVTQADDDSIDWDYGWVGSAQWVIAQQSGLSGDNGIEADNQKDDNDAEPRSNPAIWNLTLVGSNAGPGGAAKSQKGMTLRRGTAAEIRNALIVGFADAPYNIADEATVAQIDAGELVFGDSILFANGGMNEPALPAEAGEDDDDGGYDDNTFANAAGTNNRFVDPMLGAPYDLATPDFKPAAGSPALTGGATPSNGLDASATYLGAIGETDWTAGWTAYPEN